MAEIKPSTEGEAFRRSSADLRQLDALERFGKPVMLRTDNGPIFTSRLFLLLRCCC